MTTDNLQATFAVEAGELLAQLEDALLQLEENPGSRDAIDQVFRSAHTLKGSGGMAGLTALAEMAHELESAFDLVREGHIPVSPELISLTLWVSDFIRAAIAGEESRDDGSVQRVKALVATLRQISHIDGARSTAPPQDAPSPAIAASAAEGKPLLYLIRFRPEPAILQRGLQPAGILAALKDLGPCIAVARTHGIPPLDSIDPENCHVFWDVLLQSAGDMNAIRDPFVFVEDDSEILIAPLEGSCLDLTKDGEALCRLMEECAELDFADLHQRLCACGVIAAPKKRQAVDPAPAKSPAAGPPAQKAAASGGKKVADEEEGEHEYLRVRADRLDALINLVGELVTLQGRLAVTATGYSDPVLTGINEEAERLTLSLRRQVLKTRMVPIGNTFHRYRRLVRDLAQELGKDIDLVIAGEKTEIDKTMIDQLQDPLVHLVRNCIDHGIEAPQVRRTAGKTPRGSIRLAASQQGSHIVIEIGDDGAGLNLDKIRGKAERLGILAAGSQPAARELADLIFHSGLSTAESVGKISGRGVGMDAVKNTVTALRGSIDVETEAGVGSTFRIKLPLTLAIVDGLLVQVGKRRYVLPLTEVHECIELQSDAHASGRNLLMVRGEIIPYLHLRQQFDIAGDRPELEQVVIVQFRGERIGLVVDRVVGGHQTVIKSLGQMCRNAPGVSGATILGDGGIALTLDLLQLFAMAKEQEERERANEDNERTRRKGKNLSVASLSARSLTHQGAAE